MILYCECCQHTFDTDETSTADRGDDDSVTCDPCFDRIHELAENIAAAQGREEAKP